jgi:DNA repair and recombination protein RAD52
MDKKKAITELAKKLDPKVVRPPTAKGPKGEYLEGWHVIAEANRIFGHLDWSYRIIDLRCISDYGRPVGQRQAPGFGVCYIARIKVWVGDHCEKEDVGSGHGISTDHGQAHESAVKEAVTDALKRTLRVFGWPLGLALYDKQREHVGYDQVAINPPAAPEGHGSVEAIKAARTPEELVGVLARIGAENDHNDVIGARVDRIIQFINDAPSDRHLDHYRNLFAPDWHLVDAYAFQRRDEIAEQVRGYGEQSEGPSDAPPERLSRESPPENQDQGGGPRPEYADDDPRKPPF